MSTSDADRNSGNTIRIISNQLDDFELSRLHSLPRTGDPEFLDRAAVGPRGSQFPVPVEKSLNGLRNTAQKSSRSFLFLSFE